MPMILRSIRERMGYVPPIALIEEVEMHGTHRAFVITRGVGCILYEVYDDGSACCVREYSTISSMLSAVEDCVRDGCSFIVAGCTTKRGQELYTVITR